MSDGARPAQNFIPVVDIEQGTVVRNDGALIGVLMVSATNLSLKSPDEQQAVMTAFENFLNTIEFSIEIVVHSRSFDVRPYVKTLEDRLELIPEELLRLQTAMYIEYIRTIADTQHIMQKEFYVVIPYSGGGTMAPTQKKSRGIRGFLDAATSGTPTPDRAEMDARIAQLHQRMNVLIGGLSSLGLGVQQLTTEQLVELFYELYNPGDTASGAQQMAGQMGLG